MERKKKRDKPASNGVDVENLFAQGDANNRPREADHQGVGLPAKKLLAAGSPSNDTSAVSCSPQQPFATPLNWPYTPQQPLHPPTQLSSQSGQSQSCLPQVLQQQPAQQGQQGGAHQGQPPLPPGQQPTPYWPSPDFAGPTAASGPYYSFLSGPPDSNWQASSAGGNATSYSYPGGFGFPPPPPHHPGVWDPASWWAHSAHHQAMYPYTYPGYGSGYGYPMPPPPLPPPPGTYQRGFIKPPPGLSQKHQRLWEAQSMENMQLWAAMARAEAEISYQRNKLMKLEADLQAIKTHQDAVMEASMAVPSIVRPSRRDRRKKSAQAPVAIVGLPAPGPPRVKAQGRKSGNSRTALAKCEPDKNVEKDSSLDEKHKVLLGHHLSVSLDRSAPDQELNSVPTAGLYSCEIGAERAQLRHTTDSEGAGAVENHALSGERVKVESSNVDQRSLSPLGVGKEGALKQNVEETEATVGTFLKSVNFPENRAGISSESTMGNGRENWSRANAGNSGRNNMPEAGLQPLYDTANMKRSDAVCTDRTMHGWEYAGEDASEEQDEVAASGQDDDEIDEDEEAALDEITGGPKVGNAMVIDTTSGMSKEVTAFSRW